MSYQESSDFCAGCHRQVLVRRETANHVLHAFLTLLVCGFWLPIWILCALDAGPWRCTSCGQPTRKGSDVLLWVLLTAIVGVVGIPIMVILASWIGGLADSYASRKSETAFRRSLSADAAAPAAAASSTSDPALDRAWTTRPASGPRRRVAPGPSRTLWINADHGPDDHGNRASTVQPGAAVVLLGDKEQDGQAHVSSGGRAGWIEKAVLEEVR